MNQNGNHKAKEMQLACGLGWFSIGLGLAEVLAPGTVARMAGIPRQRRLLRWFGFREIASGLAIFSQRRPVQALWARVAGDVLDLAVLAAAYGSPKADPRKVTASIAAVAGVAALDVYCGQKVQGNPEAKHGIKRFEETLTINDTAENLYNFWHQFENLPSFMAHLKSVTKTGENRWHWVARGPAGTSVEWEAEIVAHRPNDFISWRSIDGSEVENAGTVRFERAHGGRGTVLRVELEYAAPGGALGATVAKLFGEAPEKQVAVDLRRFKQLMETGEVLRTDGQPSGRPRNRASKIDLMLQH
jgi:uncharacterized membrane protein